MSLRTLGRLLAAVLLLLVAAQATGGYAQITPSADQFWYNGQVRKAAPARRVAGTEGTDPSIPFSHLFSASRAGAWDPVADAPALALFSADCATLTLPGTGGTYAGGTPLGDLVANSATAGSVVALSCTIGRNSTGGPVVITRARIATSNATITNGSFRIHVYDGTPTVANGNDGAFSSTLAGHFCKIDVTLAFPASDGADGGGVPVDETACSRVLAGQTVKVLVEARAAYAWSAAQTLTISLEGFN